MDILVEKNGRYEPKPIVLDRRTEGQKKVTTTKFVLLLFCLKKVSPVLLFLAGLVGGGEGWAAVRLPKLVGDRMVLQRETELKISLHDALPIWCVSEIHLIIQKPTGRGNGTSCCLRNSPEDRF